MGMVGEYLSGYMFAVGGDRSGVMRTRRNVKRAVGQSSSVMK